MLLTLIHKTGPTLYIEYLYEYRLMSCNVVPVGILYDISSINLYANCSIRFGVPPIHTNYKKKSQPLYSDVNNQRFSNILQHIEKKISINYKEIIIEKCWINKINNR